MILKCYREELYVGIYLSKLCPSIASQFRGYLLSSDHVPSFTTIFSISHCVMTSTLSSPLSSAPSDMTPPSAMAVLAHQAHDDSLPPCSDGSRPPCGNDHNHFPPCPYCGKKKYSTNKYWKQFGKPPTTQVVVTPSATLSSTLPNTPTPHYHVTLTSVV